MIQMRITCSVVCDSRFIDMDMERVINLKDMPTSTWSGGRTTEIYIYPEGSCYADRDFIFRVSTAEVELEESDFTHLPDFFRVIASISGRMELSHAGKACGTQKASDGRCCARLEPFKAVYHFDGADETHCIGKARDLNLMLRKGRAEGGFEFLKKGERRVFNLSEKEISLLYDIDARTALIMRNGEFSVRANGNAALFRVTLL